MDVICSVLRVCGDSEQPSVTQPQEEELQSGDDLRLPQTVLFPPERIILNWTQQFNVGAGLENVGNTCYLNSALQCLTYTPPFANYMLSQEHSATCKKLGFCMMCTMQAHISEVFGKSGDTIIPVEVLTVLKLIANHFHFGRQEDAHEFLQCTLEAMQESCLAESKFDREAQETTFIHQVFGGHLRSRVQCLNCQAVSDTFEPFLNILLDIKTAADVSRALKQFVRPEVLGGANAYNCGSCKNMVTATKGLTIHRGTNVLILVLKRFDIFTGGKITKEVRYPEYLDLYPFMSEAQENPLVYRLYAVLVHYGRSSHSGHYFCYIKASNDQWYQMNDNSVTIADIKSVLTKQAYVLFYIKTTDVTETGDHNHMMTSNATVKDPQLPVHLTKVNTERERYPSFYNIYPANGFNSYYDGRNRKREWGYEQRRHSHPASQVWRGHWKKQHQRPWVSKNTYKERYYDPWKEQMYSSPKVYNNFQQAQNGKDYLCQAYRNRRKSMLHRKISNKGTVNHFRAERESRPEAHQDEKEETMTTESWNSAERTSPAWTPRKANEEKLYFWQSTGYYHTHLWTSNQRGHKDNKKRKNISVV